LNHSDVSRCEDKGEPCFSRVCCGGLEVQDVGGAGAVKWWKSDDSEELELKQNRMKPARFLKQLLVKSRYCETTKMVMLE